MHRANWLRSHMQISAASIRHSTPTLANTHKLTLNPSSSSSLPLVILNRTRHSQYAASQFARFTHNRTVPRSSSSSSSRPSLSGSVLGSGRGGGVNDLFDVSSDEGRSPPTTIGGRLKKGGEVMYRYIFGGTLIVIMSSAAFMLGVYYFANPEEEVRKRTIKMLSSHPVALQLIGPHLNDVTLYTRGSRRMQAFHRYPYFGSHPIDMEFDLSGKNGKAIVFVQYWKSGEQWKPIYLHLDTRRGRAVLLDIRAQQMK